MHEVGRGVALGERLFTFEAVEVTRAAGSALLCASGSQKPISA